MPPPRIRNKLFEDLKPHKYSFDFKKEYMYYLRKFAFYNEGLSVSKEALVQELEFYGVSYDVTEEDGEVGYESEPESDQEEAERVFHTEKE